MRKLYLFFLFIITQFSFAQEDAWVYFTDKQQVDYYLQNPLEMLSQRALDRRANQSIALDTKDVPITASYRQAIENQTGITVLAQSKWMNCLHVRGSVENIQALTQLPFVAEVFFANRTLNTAGRHSSNNKISLVQKNLETEETFLYGNSSNQIQMLNGHLLHQNNYTGAGKIIAVMDNGFPGVNIMSPFQRLMQNNQILGGYDFVNRDENVFDGGTHGTLVLSTMGGFVDNQLVGTAPDAAYYLFKTEANDYENPLEESLWVEAAEMADSLGVDIINTSLGYSTFDNPAYNYTYADMNGVTTFSSRGADIAFSRGMFCVTSAGNSGSSSWLYISTPADAINTLTVGAVNAAGNYASFSSIGPSSDLRIKPDVVAQGVSSIVATASGNISSANGTSFSGPITAGLVACLWQALPQKTNAELLNIIRESAHLYQNPTAQLGYGIPNFNLALENALSLGEVKTNEVLVYPNPVADQLTLILPSENTNATFELYNQLGQLIFQSSVLSTQKSIDFQSFSNGIYFYKVTFQGEEIKGKLIKK